VPVETTRLKLLLQQRHWQTYSAFCREYDRVARVADPRLVGSYPSRAQFHRWLSGEVKGIPYPDHCRVLEEMLPGWNVGQLFAVGSADGTGAGAHIPAQPTAAISDASTPRQPSLNEPQRPVSLRPHIERAFEQAHVTIDFAGYSSETLHGVLSEPLDKIRTGRIAPESFKIRMLLPAPENPRAFPIAIDPAENPRVQERMVGVMRRHVEAIIDLVTELGTLGLVKDASVGVKVAKLTPLFKLYVLNGQDAFFSFYQVKEHVVNLRKKPVPVLDAFGKDSTLFHFAASPQQENSASHFIDEAMLWFDSIWNNVAEDLY
jgi:hypothetical protein